MRFEYFQLVDRVADIDIGERRIRSLCTVPEQSTIFEGHFPGYPLMPGVLLTECMAQTLGWLASAACGFSAMPILVGVKDAKFRVAVLPGDELEFEGKLVHEGSGYSVGECTGRRDGTIVCDARITFRNLPYPNLQCREALLRRAEQLNVPTAEFTR